MEGRQTSLRVRLILIASILAGLIFLKFITPERITGYDGSFYAAMARKPISSDPRTTTAPYCYRLLPAGLVHFIPLKTETAFILYNAFICGASAYLLFFLFRDYGYPGWEAGMGVFFFLSSWVNARFSLFYPFHIDGTYYFILILAFFSLRRNQDLLFLSTLFLGAVTREYFLSLIPVYYLYRKEKGLFWDRRAAGKTIELALGPVVLFTLLRVLIPESNLEFSYWKHMTYFTRMFFLHGRRIIHSYFNVYGVVMFILLLHLPTTISFLRRNIYLLAYLAFSLFFLMVGGADRCRINFISFPAVFILALQGIREHSSVYRNKLMAGFLVAAQLYLMRVWQPMAVDNYRKIWWSAISFCPEAVFRQSSVRYILFGIAFGLIYLGLRLRLSGSRSDNPG